MVKLAIFAYLLSLATITTGSSTSQSDFAYMKEKAEASAVVFLGDSRTVGMKIATTDIVDDDNEFFIAKSGEGYSWLKSTGISKLKNTISSHKNINDWTIVTNLGVNDPDNAEKYVEEYEDLMTDIERTNINKSITMYVVSINPVDENKCSSRTNKEIDKINEIFKDGFEDKTNSIIYLNTNNYVKNIMVSTDGLHYTDSTYRKIYKKILESIILEKSGNYTLAEAEK